MAQLVALMSGVVLGGVAEVVGSNLARGKIFTASIGSVDSLYPSVYIYIYIYEPRSDKRDLLAIKIKSETLTEKERPSCCEQLQKI